MDEVQPEDRSIDRAGEHSAHRDTGGFWRTLPGILTAAGTFLAGLAGLAAVVVPNISPRSSPGDSTEQPATQPAGPSAQVMNANPSNTTPATQPPTDAPAPTAAPTATAPLAQPPPSASIESPPPSD